VEDVVADGYFQAWRGAADFDARRGSPVTWLLTIVRSRALDLMRHRKASPEVAGADPASDATPADFPGPAELLDGVQTRSRLHAALSALSAQERSVLCLAYYREMTHREVSLEIGLPLGTVKSLILRAQAKLRAQLVEPDASPSPATP
jgi:RNA polymerase sigma-70 factor (ECF subfamily)